MRIGRLKLVHIVIKCGTACSVGPMDSVVMASMPVTVAMVIVVDITTVDSGITVADGVTGVTTGNDTVTITASATHPDIVTVTASRFIQHHK